MSKKLFTLLIAFFSVWMICPAQEIETIVLPAANKTGGIPLMEALQKRQSQRSFSSKEIDTTANVGYALGCMWD